MKNSSLVLLGAAAIGAYVLLKGMQKVEDIPAQVASAPANAIQGTEQFLGGQIQGAEQFAASQLSGGADAIGNVLSTVGSTVQGFLNPMENNAQKALTTTASTVIGVATLPNTFATLFSTGINTITHPAEVAHSSNLLQAVSVGSSAVSTPPLTIPLLQQWSGKGTANQTSAYTALFGVPDPNKIVTVSDFTKIAQSILKK